MLIVLHSGATKVSILIPVNMKLKDIFRNEHLFKINFAFELRHEIFLQTV
jgi:hypothetical protein